MNSKVNLIIPFSGFYETIAGYVIECAIEHEIEINNNIKSLDYKKMQEQYKNQYCDKLESLFKANNCEIDIADAKIVSPNEYNFMNDEIHCNVQFDKLLNVVRYAVKNCWNTVERLAIEYLSSRSGFHSFYDDISDASKWTTRDISKFTVEWKIIIEAVFLHIIGDDINSFELEDYEIEVMELDE